jgi:NDP-sugar pyrophosphorylase family protein
VVDFGEKTGYGPGLVYAGVALIDFSRASQQLGALATSFSLENDVLTPLAAMRKLRFSESDSKFIDVGTPWRLLESQKLLNNEK